MGFFALTQLQVDLNVVAALLTIVGYSLNDTVVIYDRIRENLRKYRKMAIVPLAEPLAQRDAVAHDGHVSVDPARAGNASDPRSGRHLRAYDRDFPRHFRRHLLVDLHLSPVLVWLGVKPDSFLRSDDEEEAPEAQPA